MALRRATRDEYEAFKATVPEHDHRIRELRRRGRLFYVSQEVFTPDGAKVAEHREDGTYWIAEPAAKGA